MTAFRVGMKVCCVDEFEAGYPLVKHPVIGREYETRTIHGDADGTFIRLVEVVNEKFLFVEGFEEPAFDSRCFRPIVSRPTSIAVFQAMLTGKKAEEPVNG